MIGHGALEQRTSLLAQARIDYRIEAAVRQEDRRGLIGRVALGRKAGREQQVARQADDSGQRCGDRAE